MAHGTKHPRGHREGTVEVNGTGLRVEEAGHGEPAVVFSPALFTNRELFDAPFAALSSDHRCIRYDHRGQGDRATGQAVASTRSPKPKGTATHLATLSRA